ncbi:MAG: type IX secretion system sortase PorU [Bacteroidales bacterium]|jgi:hypothetical protein|nr:type IX secretion system sortase PorU [Bacteroidales bacterium]
MLTRRNIILIIASLLLPVYSLADSGPQKRTLQWNPVQKIRISDTRTVSEFYFDGATYNRETADLPVYSERFAVGDPNIRVEAVFTEEVWENINESSIRQISGFEKIASDLEVKTFVAKERKRPYAVISFIPLRRNAATGTYQRLVSFTFRLNYIDMLSPVSGKTQTFKQNSVLASGNWYKVAVQFTGVHKVSYDELSAMGIDVDGIDPRNLRVYGNGGGMLPENTSAPRPDDLIENAVFVSGEADGSFDQGDYLLFYAESPHSWSWDDDSEQYIHRVNIYSNNTYYFITPDLGPGKRIQGISSTTQPATHQVNQFTDRQFIEKEDLNIVRTGRDWFEYPPYEVQTSAEYTFSFPNIDLNSEIKMRTRVAARSSTSSNFRYYLNGTNLLETVVVQAVSLSTDQYARTSESESTFSPTSSNVVIEARYSKPLSASMGWMDYIALNARRNLVYSGGQMAFRDPESAGTGNIAQYNISGASSSVVLWDVTDKFNIKRINANLNGAALSFRLPADSIHEFISFDGSSYYSVSFVGKVPNQNLHALQIPDMVIVAHKLFLNQAARLANHHKENDGLDVFVVDVAQVYNEFSSGAQDITAIRNFMKMLYDQAVPGDECRYLMLFGDASYDYKNRIDDNSNFVPTWEDERSMNIISSIATDDYYGFLDDGESGNGGSNLLDIGIGRVVVANQEEAGRMVDKILHYASNQPEVFGNWRNVVCFVADDEDGNLHVSQAEKMAVRLDTGYGKLNVDKIYLDAYPQESTSGGQRAPEVNEAINRRIARGTVIMNYTGHGGEAGWAHERILEISDINGWENFDKLPIFITATCEFSRYDDPTRISAGEFVLLNPDGGAVSMFTTARATYGSPNFELNNAMYDLMFEEVDGEYPRFGDLITYAKNKNGTISDNDRKFILLGDPALRLPYPTYDVNTIRINDIAISSIPDTLKALQKVTINGSVVDEFGQTLTAYNGILYPKVFDKPTSIETLVTDPDSKPFTFDLLIAVLYNGKANVKNGEFTFSFIVPKDIAYNYGYGKISYYASNDAEDASGYYDNVIIGGYDNNVPPDEHGPEIQLYLNDENFAFGGITDENPVLLAYVSDSSGINTVGTGIGHDIVTTLDNNNNKSVIINDYYEADVDSYTSGVIRYPFASLEEGSHSLKLKVWDVHNNSSEAFTEFVVATSAELAIDHVLNYPNPFTTSTAFYFDHNQPNTMLEVQVQIYTVSGRLIKTIDEFVITDGYRSEPLYWDGLDDFGDRIGRGVYIYKLRVRSQDGSIAEKLEKLVILR